jgi:hypothetical protein
MYDLDTSRETPLHAVAPFHSGGKTPGKGEIVESSHWEFTDNDSMAEVLANKGYKKSGTGSNAVRFFPTNQKLGPDAE